ncbi:hypothetical protein BV22DRAFT_907797 [Leucogyrophana mollusca]|uniref:Uncharacterized protein n=1 Tax=Leucogyrophana mollusca TaxID=85980 RepID=A0ACB8AYI8_9AGAM|nr:hypothetical protein BV22DRAFT_907797 [Leucogyrophana mollusca]
MDSHNLQLTSRAQLVFPQRRPCVSRPRPTSFQPLPLCPLSAQPAMRLPNEISTSSPAPNTPGTSTTRISPRNPRQTALGPTKDVLGLLSSRKTARSRAGCLIGQAFPSSL